MPCSYRRVVTLEGKEDAQSILGLFLGPRTWNWVDLGAVLISSAWVAILFSDVYIMGVLHTIVWMGIWKCHKPHTDAVLYNHVTKMCRYVHAFTGQGWVSEVFYCHARMIEDCVPMLQAFETQIRKVSLDMNGRDRIWNTKMHSQFAKVCSTCTWNTFCVHI